MFKAFLLASRPSQLRHDLMHIPSAWRCLLMSIVLSLGLLVYTGQLGLLETFNAIILIIHMMLMTQRRITSHVWGLLSALSYGLLSMQADNLQNAIIQLMIFIPCCLIGPYYWIHRMVGHRCVVRSISDLTLEKQILLQITALVFIAVGIYTQAVYGFGLIVIFAILGGIFNIVRIKEQWYLWLLIALIGMGFYLTQTGFAYNGLSTFVLYGALIYLSISGLRHWDKAYDIKTLP